MTRQAKTLRAAAEAMDPEDAVAWLLDIVETQAGHDPGGIATMIRWGFRAQEARLLSLLLAAGPTGLSHDRVQIGMSVTGEPVTPDHARVVIRRIKRHLLSLGWPVSIISLWGVGYCADHPPGFAPPAYGGE